MSGSLSELVESVRRVPLGRLDSPTVTEMLREGRGTRETKHRFLAAALSKRYPGTNPELVQRVYRLDRRRAKRLFGAQVSATVPRDGVIDVHWFVRATIDGERIDLDVSFDGPPWDGRSPIEPVCGPGRDLAAGIELARTRPDLATSSRQRFLAALEGGGERVAA